jgi:hypothetical protein
VRRETRCKGLRARDRKHRGEREKKIKDEIIQSMWKDYRAGKMMYVGCGVWVQSPGPGFGLLLIIPQQVGEVLYARLLTLQSI